MASSRSGAGPRGNVPMLVPVVVLLTTVLGAHFSVAASTLGRRVDAGQGLKLDKLPFDGRRLLDATTPAAARAAAGTTTTPIIVNTFEDLSQAVTNGAQDIEIRSHIDARGAAPDEVLVLPALKSTRSIRGNCEEDPPDALKPFVTADMPDRQCFVVALAPADSWIFKIEAQTWLDNLKIVEGRVPLADGEEAPPAIVVEKAGQMWATQVTLEGAQAVNGTALNQRGLMVHGKAYMGGSRFRRLGATLPIAEVKDGGHLSLSHILFDENYGLPDPADGVVLDALIHLYDGAVRFEHCGWSRNKHQFPIAIVEPDTNSANVYAHPDMTVQINNQEKGHNQVSQALSDIPAGAEGDELFLSERSAWFTTVEGELPIKEGDRAIDAPDDSSLEPGAHGAAAATNLHQLPSGKMAVAPADVIMVTSAKELYDAVQQGIRDILLTEHLDLSTEDPDDLGFMLPLAPSTRSIRGGCDAGKAVPDSLANSANPPGEVPSGRCLMAAPVGLLRLASPNHYLWLDSVHLHAMPENATQAASSTNSFARRLLEVSGSGSLVFVSNSSMMGDTKGMEAVALSDASAAMHIEDTAFTDMTVPSTSAAILSTRGALSIANCPLTNMQATDNTTVVLAEHRGTLTLQGQPACSGCAGNIYAISDDALAFADKVPDGEQVVNLDEVPIQPVSPEAPPEGTTAALSLDHPWLAALKETLAKPINVENLSSDGDYDYVIDDEEGAVLTDSLPSDAVNGGPVVLDPPPEVTAVATAADLVQTLAESKLDIVITDHLDLRGLSTDFISFVLTVGANTRSIRGGECGPIVDSFVGDIGLDPPIQDITVGQCVLLADFGVFHVFSHNHDIWFDQLYIRFVAPEQGNEGLLRHAFMLSGQGSTTFMTGITVQGGGTAQRAGSLGEGVLVSTTQSSGVHMHKALFQDLTVLDADNSFIKTAGPLSMNNTVFQNVLAPEHKAFITVKATGMLRLATVTFGPEASGTRVFTQNDGVPTVFSAQPVKVKNTVSGAEEDAATLAEIPDPSPFTSLGNQWLQSLMAGLRDDEDSPVVNFSPSTDPGRSEIFKTPAGTAESTPPSSGGSGPSAAIAAVAGVLVAVVLGALAVMFAVRRYRRRKGNDTGTNGAFRRAWIENSSFSVISEGADKQHRDSNNGKNRRLDSGESSGIPATPGPQSGGMFSGLFSMFKPNKKQKTDEPAPKLRHVPTTIGHKHDSLGLGNSAALSVPLQPLVKALDALCVDKTLFLDVYVALGPANRKIGRDAVVQLFQHRMNHSRVAVKFYRTRATFDRERALRSNGDLSPICVPKIRTLADPGVGPGGYTWPPCIVLECGVNLVTFLNHVEQNDGSESAYPVACAVVAELAELVELMHEVGFAHRKLRPENVMYIPERDAWSLTDIDRAARVGLMNAPAPPTEYTAPEVWKAMQLARTCLTTAAADVWAVGALAFELSTGERVLLPGSKPREAAFGLNERAQAAADAGKLGTISDVVLECLHNDPQMRPTAQSIVPVLEAETERARIDLKLLQDELAQLSQHVDGYTQARVYLHAVCKTSLLPQAARLNLNEPPEEQPTAAEFKSLIQSYCMALGPDTVTLPKGLPFRKERLDVIKDINSQLNFVLKNTKL